MTKAFPKHLQELYDAALRTRLNAYSPYSGHKVGAAVRTKSGKIFTGCNIENSSYGGTICAERVAITGAVAAEGKLEIVEMMVVTDATPPWPPCGLCRQVIAEFAAPETPIHAANLNGDLHTVRFADIFPSAFTPGYLLQQSGTNS